jgi:hypothetical protein
MSDNTRRLHNSGATELVYDTEGHVLAAGETVDVEMPVSDERTKGYLKSGELVEIKETKSSGAKSGGKSEDK